MSSSLSSLLPEYPSFTVVSTFAGCGGSSLGYRLAGGDVRLAVEWDHHAADVYRRNFPGAEVFEGDITDLTVTEVLGRTNLAPGELDIFDGSPPCQGFSSSGKQQFHDPRNHLFREYARLLQGLKPKTFIMENVAGMVRGKMRLLFVEILKALKGCGYRVSAKLLDAQYFEVPQRRKRMIFVGVREDLCEAYGVEPSHPKPYARPKTLKQVFPYMKRVVNDTSGLHSQGDVTNKVCPTINRFARAHFDVLEPEQTDLYPSLAGEWEKIGEGGHSKKCQSLIRPHRDQVCPTITTQAGQRTGAAVVHPTEKRKFTIQELKIICSFPDEFDLFGTLTQKADRLGNSVPPNFMKHIAGHVRDEILAKIREGEQGETRRDPQVA